MKKTHCYRCGETTGWKSYYDEYHQSLVWYCPVCAENEAIDQQVEATLEEHYLNREPEIEPEAKERGLA